MKKSVHAVDGTFVELGNVASKLNHLQQNKFVENRVVEDIEPEKKVETKVEQHTKVSDVEATKKLLDESVRMLNKCYEKVSLDEDDESDTEDDKLRFAYRPINPYEHKRRPYIIGTKEWLEKYHIGLQSSEDDEQEDEEEEEEESEEISETESHATEGQSAPPSAHEPIQYFIPPVPKSASAAPALVNIPTSKTSIPINSSNEAAPSIFKPQFQHNPVIPNLFSNEPPPDLDTVSEISKNLFTDSDDENQNFLPVIPETKEQTLVASKDETDQKEIPNQSKSLVNDFFNQNLSKQIASQAAAFVTKKSTNLFDESDDETEEQATPVKKVSQPLAKVIPTEIEYTLKRNEKVLSVTPKKEEEKRKIEEKKVPEVSTNVVKTTKKKITNLFDDDSDDDDDFFLPSKTKVAPVVQTKKFEEKKPTKDEGRNFLIY